MGDQVALLKDFPDTDLYKGYLCTIIAVLGGGEKNDDIYYEI